MLPKIADIKNWLGQGSINIFGMPFAGKDTQGAVLADLFEAQLLGGGTILRNSIIPPDIKQIMNNGGLIPTADYLDIVLPYLSHEQFVGKPLLLSSVGRWHGEEHGVQKAARASGHPLRAVILITIPEAVARTRHSTSDSSDRGIRADDTAGRFDTRLLEYYQKTLPVIDFYKQQGLLLEVDGSPSPPSVTEAILQKLTTVAAASVVN